MIGPPRRSRLFPAAAGAFLMSSPCHAHLVNTGLGPIYDGVSHFALSPEDLLPALALALLAGQRGRSTGRTVLFVLPALWLIGGLLGLRFPGVGHAPAITGVSFLALGGLVAAEVRLRPIWVTGLAVTTGLMHGGLNGSALSLAGTGIPALAGIVATIFVTFALVTASVVSLRAPWGRIAVRVAGSWIAAVGLLLFGWLLQAR